MDAALRRAWSLCGFEYTGIEVSALLSWCRCLRCCDAGE
jgi:hypothetical protein